MIKESPELAAVMQRLLGAVENQDVSTLRSMTHSSDQLLIIGTAAEEWTYGANAVGVLITQVAGVAKIRYEWETIVAYEAGQVGWAACKVVARVGEAHRVPLRMVAVFHLEEGVWRVVLWHLSEPRPNNPEILGVDLNDTLASLIDAINDGSEVHVEAQESPRSTVTMVFTDVEGSTSRAFQMGDVAWGRLITRHFHDMERIAESNEGVVVKTLGDGAMLAFNSASGGLRAARDIQRSVAHLENGDVSVRVGVHTGDAVRSGGDYLGQAVDKAARVAAAAKPGQSLVTDASRALVDATTDFRFGDAIVLDLKGVPSTTSVYPLMID